MFIAGPPAIEEVRPGARSTTHGGLLRFPVFTILPGGWVVPDYFGDQIEEEDLLPGQLYGEQARCGRLVLDLARRLHLTVSVYDANHPESDRQLVARYVADDDDMPILVRSDGTRLVGEESFVPRTLQRFLEGG